MILPSLGAALRCVTGFDLPGACTVRAYPFLYGGRTPHWVHLPSYLCPRLEFLSVVGLFLFLSKFLLSSSPIFFLLRLKQGTRRRADDSFRYERVRTYICMLSLGSSLFFASIASPMSSSKLVETNLIAIAIASKINRCHLRHHRLTSVERRERLIEMRGLLNKRNSKDRFINKIHRRIRSPHP